MATLIMGSGPREGYYPLGQRTTVIGRDEALPIQVLDDRVSRRHVQIRYDPADASYHVLDMKSSNGVFINGRRIFTDTVLVDGDQIQIGDTKLLFAAADFDDKDIALAHFKKVGERRRSTLMQ
jgi:pSer/pThr/pTyr-binding forkhead associated (FHA) protein